MRWEETETGAWRGVGGVEKREIELQSYGHIERRSERV